MTSQQNGDLLEEMMELVKNQQKLIDKQHGLIELHKKLEDELRRTISLLEKQISLLKSVAVQKDCYTCKYLASYVQDEPCMSCTRCIINHCTNDQSDKWESKA